MAKANKDGWIRHRSNKCPVEDSCIVEARDSEGLHYGPCRADNIAWESDGCHEKITSYRVYKLEQKKETEVKDQRSTDASYLVVAAKQGVELAEHLRARYLATFEEKKALEVTIAARQNDIAMIEKEQEELRGKVRALGFDFYDAPKVDEDMSDQENWRVGDVIECIESHIGEIGELATITKITKDHIYKNREGKGETNHPIGAKYWKFHSRPK